MTEPSDSDERLRDASGEAGAVDEDARLSELTARLAAMERDRDYWRAQHDQVMADWKADLEELGRAGGQNAETQQRRRAMTNLLRFFDPRTGAVSALRDGELLSDAFAAAFEATQGGLGLR